MLKLFRVLAIFLLSSTTAFAAGRHALIVGVDRYDTIVGRDKFGNDEALHLAKPSKDATAVADRLRQTHGFDAPVVLIDEVLPNAGPAIAIKDAVETHWSKMLGEAKDGDVVLFYFAGHGVELRGLNYLLPSDAVFHWKSRKIAQLAGTSIRLRDMLDKLAARQALHPRLVGVFIIDACRDNPAAAQSENSAAAEDSGQLVISMGTAVPPSRQVFISFSAGSGQTALDGREEDKNSVYARVLLDLLSETDISLGDLAQRLRVQVYEDALTILDENNEPHIQTPAIYDQLQSDLTIAGRQAAGERRPSQTTVANELRSLGGRGRSLRHRDVLIDCPSCPDLVVVRADAFQMGSSAKIELQGRVFEPPPNEVGRHVVSIAKPFAIGKYEVTNRQWNACLADAERCKVAERTVHGEPGDAMKPVSNITWSDAVKYVEWLSVVTGHKYRLPSEAEWEYVARAGKSAETLYSFGNDAERLCDYANGADRSMGLLPYVNATCDDGVDRGVSIVGRYKPNDWGIYDLHGNVWEWTADCWQEGYASAPADGTARDKPACDSRVIRGGSWRSRVMALRTAVRSAYPPDQRRATIGLRVVRELP